MKLVLGSAIIITLFTIIDKSFPIIFACLFLVIIFPINLYQLLKRNRKYLKSILLSENGIELKIVDKYEKVETLKAALEDVKIKIPELLVGLSRFGGNFKLQIDTKSENKFETVFEQHEIGKWNLNLFKKFIHPIVVIKMFRQVYHL